ncbi:MAG TPA: hypothetical protein VE914_19900 [Candidatus Angelobacter sp.]|nr:hypothetical protein [Candidatus Angelobacter sp.]
MARRGGENAPRPRWRAGTTAGMTQPGIDVIYDLIETGQSRCIE